MKNKSRSKFRSREIYIHVYIFIEKGFILPNECLYVKTLNSVRVS